MKLHIENFAKIGTADIRLDGLTVVAGPNNTGKSTLGKVLYSFFRGQSNIERRVKNERIKAIRDAFRKAAYDEVPEKICVDILNGTLNPRSVLAELLSEGNVSNDLGDSSGDNIPALALSPNAEETLSATIEEQIKRARTMPFEQVSWSIFRRVFDCVFHGQYHPLKVMDSPAQICLEIKGERNEVTFFHDHAEWSRPTKLFATARLISTPDAIGLLNVRDLEHNAKYANVLDKDSYELACTLATRWGRTPVIAEAAREDDVREAMSGLNGAIGGDFMRDADGAFGIREDGNIEMTRAENLSMGMKSLALLRLMVMEGALSRRDVLILDEPEVHLHPAWQLEYAYCIVCLQKLYGLTMMVTTHSPYFLKALEKYSREEGIADKTAFYFSHLDETNSRCLFDDCKGDLNGVFKSLYGPFAELM